MQMFNKIFEKSLVEDRQIYNAEKIYKNCCQLTINLQIINL